jgi:hypothetical protein
MDRLGDFRPKALSEPCLADFVVLCVDAASRNIFWDFFQAVPDVMQGGGDDQKFGCLFSLRAVGGFESVLYLRNRLSEI